MRKKILYKIIGHKYFRQPQPLNLLTWDAKEQIRYLHAEYPDEWTVDRLADSFPVDRNGVINIIRSKFGPRSIGDVIRHDRRVKGHWVSLNAGDSGKEGGPVTLRFEKILDDVRVKLLGNAAGIASLPMPEIGRFLSAGKSGAGMARRDKTPGPFESIVKGYCDERRAKQVLADGDKTLQSKELLKENRETNQTLLEAVARSTQGLTAKTALGREHRALVTRESTERCKAVNTGLSKFDFVDENLQTSDPHRSSKDKRIQTLLDAEFPDFDAEPPRRSIRRHETVVRSKHDVDAEHATGIVRTDESETRCQPTEFEDAGFARKKQYARKAVDERSIFEQIRYDVPREVLYDHQEAYMYDERKGYQHPLGKAARDIPEKIEVPKDSSQGGERVYRQGKNYYDANGEFLYRLP